MIVMVMAVVTAGVEMGRMAVAVRVGEIGVEVGMVVRVGMTVVVGVGMEEVLPGKVEEAMRVCC